MKEIQPRQTSVKTSKVQEEIRCPSCHSDGAYRYGRTRDGKQRYYCLCCKMQFTGCTKRTLVNGRPQCPSCGHPMHLYMRNGEKCRFRCSLYPRCRVFVVITARRENESGRPIISILKGGREHQNLVV